MNKTSNQNEWVYRSINFLMASILGIYSIYQLYVGLTSGKSESLLLNIFLLVVSIYIFITAVVNIEYKSDERINTIKQKSGFYLWIINLLILFIFTLLVNFDVFSAKIALNTTFILAILTFPIVLFMINKKM